MTASSIRKAISGSARWTTTRKTLPARCTSSTDEGCVRRDDGYVITNGPAESPDGSILYHTDTLERSHLCLRPRARTGCSPKSACSRASRARAAYPDGPMRGRRRVPVDRALRRQGPEPLRARRPNCSRRSTLPCANVTKAAFGGNDLQTLYITTAWKGLED